jgi:aldose 1-epimerase
MSKIQVHQLQNRHWQVGINPQTGASIAYGRVRYGGVWLDIMRPTPERDYDNASLNSSFLMIPWSNRIRAGKFYFNGTTYQLDNLKADGTAMHGDVRGREWTVIHADETQIRLILNSAEQENINFPFKFQAEVEYKLQDTDFVMTIKLKNIDQQDFPAGFGFHPYFVRGSNTNDIQVKIPCDRHYELDNALPTTGSPLSLSDNLDFRELRTIGKLEIDDVFTSRRGDQPTQIVYPEWNLQLDYHADSLFKHWILFTPPNKPFFALEPVTNTNDGFNLYDEGHVDTGVFVLEPNQEKQGTTFLRIKQYNG